MIEGYPGGIGGPMDVMIRLRGGDWYGVSSRGVVGVGGMWNGLHPVGVGDVFLTRR